MFSFILNLLNLLANKIQTIKYEYVIGFTYQNEEMRKNGEIKTLITICNMISTKNKTKVDDETPSHRQRNFFEHIERLVHLSTSRVNTVLSRPLVLPVRHLNISKVNLNLSLS